MKNIFPGYYRKTDEEINKMWQNGILCFDANVLLNLYRYSDETRNELLSLIDKFKSKICLPHQAALEFNRNRYEVISDQEKTYKDFISKLNQIENDLKSTSKPPFLSKKNHTAIQNVFKKVNDEVEKSIDKYANYLKLDEVYDKISELFNGKITESFNNDEIENIYQEGVKRYQLKQPPGFEDEKTKKDNRKFGDLILWKQIIKVAQDNKAPIILITDERKSDWWWKLKDGRNMGPRNELINEMKIEAAVDFHMYSSERFMSYGVKYLNTQINTKAIEELQELARNERQIDRRERSRLERRIEERQKIEKDYLEKLRYLDHEIRDLKHRINSLMHGVEVYKEEPIEKPETQDRIIEYSIAIQEMKEKLEILLKERFHLIEKINYKRNFLKNTDLDAE